MGLTLQKAARIARYSMAPNKPYHVQWMITRKCNYRCRGCNVWREQDTNYQCSANCYNTPKCNVWREQDTKELSTEEVKRGLDILKDLGVVEIVFSGGNPLLREDVGEILEYASHFFVTTVYDNGSMAMEKIDALRSVDFVAISLDSLDSRKNDYVKGVKGSWEKAMQTIEKLHANGIRVGVSPTISQFNLYEMLDFTNYFLRKGIPVWYCLYSYDTSDDSNQLFKIGRKNDEFVIKDNKVMVELCDSLMDIGKKDSNLLITTKTLEAIKGLYLNGNRIWKCRALRNFFIIDHLGRVAGCHLNKPAASIFELPKVWESKKFNGLRRIYGECSKCIYLCYIVYSLHGSVVGNLEIAREKWRSAVLFLKRKGS